MQKKGISENGRGRAAQHRLPPALSEISVLLATLRSHGCDVPPLHSDYGPSFCGASIKLNVSQLMRDPLALADAAVRIRSQTKLSTPLMLTMSGLGNDEASVEALEEFCGLLSRAGVRRCAQLGVCLAAPLLPLQAFALITRRYFGNGPRFVLLNRGAEHSQGVTRRMDKNNWNYLWRNRASRWAVFPAYSGVVYSTCPLLSDEAADTVLPTFGIQAPADSAWLPIRLHLPRVADSAGNVHRQVLEEALQTCVEAAERLLDLLHWPADDQGADARANRRVAVLVTGFGELIQTRNHSPTDLDVVGSLSRLAGFIRETLWSRSTSIARRAPLLPAIVRCNPGLAASSEVAGNNWSARWREAVSRVAVRHRNLLVMSPYSVLPENDPDCAACVDLLPIIAHADAYSFACTQTFNGWNPLQFKQFHQRAQAIMQQRNDVSVVATGV